MLKPTRNASSYGKNQIFLDQNMLGRKHFAAESLDFRSIETQELLQDVQGQGRICRVDRADR